MSKSHLTDVGSPPPLASTSTGPHPGLPHTRVSALRQLGPPKHQAERVITDSALTMATCRGVAGGGLHHNRNTIIAAAGERYASSCRNIIGLAQNRRRRLGGGGGGGEGWRTQS